MAMSAGTRGGPVAEINVTPMADVMIVLLVMFMLVTPYLHTTSGVSLPAAANAVERDEGSETAVVVLRDDGSAWLGDEALDAATLLLRLRDRLDRTGPQRLVHVKAGRRLPYSRVMEVLDTCREAGADQVALRTEPKPGS